MNEVEAGFVGFVDNDGTLTFGFITRNTSFVPTNADATPTYDIYSADMSTRIVTGATASVNSNESAGGYYLNQSISSGSFAAGGLYTVIIKYAISSAARRRCFFFQVT